MRKLDELAEVVRRRSVTVFVVLIVGFFAVGLIIAMLPRTYEAASHVLIVNQSAGRDPSVSTIDLPVVASSSVVLERVTARLHLAVPLIKLQKALRVKVGSRSSIMEISYRDDVADRAVAVPNAVADELARYYEQISTASANVTIRKIDSAIADVQQRLRRISAQLAQQDADAPYLDSDKALESLTSRVDDLELQRDLAAAALVNDSAEVSALDADGRELSSVVRRETLEGDPLYRDLTDAAAHDSTELTAADAIHTAEHPDHIYLAPKVRNESAAADAEARRILQSPDAVSPSRQQNDALRRKAQALVAGDQAKLTALDRVLAAEQARLKEVPNRSVALAWLRLQRDSAQSDYLTLTNHRNVAVAGRAEALSLGSVMVVDRAVRADTQTVGVGRVPLGIFSMLLVVALALASAFLVEMLDPGLRSGEQIQDLYGAPLLVTIDN